MDLNRMLRQAGNREIVNKDLIYLEDRNLDPIIVNCYSNLFQAKLAAWDIVYSDSSTEFECEFKAQISKIKSKYKDKLNKNKHRDVSVEDLASLLGRHGTSESININNLHNTFKILKLKYYVDPDSTIKNKDKLNAINRTLQNYDRETEGYKNKVQDSYDYLVEMKKKTLKEIENGEYKNEDNVLPEEDLDLFAKEQIILLPDYRGDGKFVINGTKYYGVFNNCAIGVLTQSGSYGVKVFKNKQMITVYLLLSDDVMYVKFFSTDLNLFHVLTEKSALTTPMEEVFPPTDDPRLQKIYEATYKHAQLLEQNSNELVNYTIRGQLPRNDKAQNGRAGLGDVEYRKKLMMSVKEYVKIKDKPHDKKERYFEFLGKLEEEIYIEINGKRAKSKKLDVSKAKNRINLQPMSIIKVIKKGAGELENNILFTSTSTEPNPFDIFYLLTFVKVSLHTETRKNKGDGSKMKDNEKLIKFTDTEYLGEFCPKSEENIGRVTTVKVSLPSKHLKKRQRFF